MHRAKHIVLRGFTLGVLGLAAPGCAGGLFGDGSGYDSQACVERALRRHPEMATAREGIKLFRERCFEQDGGACSALGVAYEAGLTGAPDAGSAATAYQRACQLANPRGCSNLGALLASGALGTPDYHRALMLFEASCNQGEKSGCAHLGRLYRDGFGVPADRALATDLFERACDDGEAGACADLAGLLATSAPAAALALNVRSCLDGDQEACARMDQPAPRPGAADARPSVASR